jgi:glycosyltransferase involved in cell wall biosynthesis
MNYNPRVRVSVIVTVLNEADSVGELLESLVAQRRPPDEIVVSDGGSRDGTLERAGAFAGRLPLRVVPAPGANISQGRNIAIRAATGDVIACTDAGSCCAPEWLECLVAPFENPPVQVVAGFFRPDPRSVLETAMGATVLPEVRDVNPRTFLPSSRSVAYRKAAWQAVGGYPEWLDFCEDVVFDLALRSRFGPFVFAPEAVVAFRPRGSLRALARQYYQYARGDGKARLFTRQHAVRYAAYLVVAPLLTYAALKVSPWLWLAGLLAGLAYLRLPLRRLRPYLPRLTPAGRLGALAYLPLIRLTGDVAKMLGYPAGVAWRLRRRS